MGSGFETARIESAVEISSDLKTGVGLGGAGVVEDLLVGVQRFARPVARDCGEEAMLDGIPWETPTTRAPRFSIPS